MQFAASDGKETTVAQYFQDQYKVSIRDRNLPCVRVGNGKVLLPPEICEVLPKQRYGKLNGDQTAGMIKHCAERPGDKLAKLQDKIREVGKEASDEMRAFGLNVKGEMAQVNGRILPHPTLAYSGKSSYDPKASSAALMGS